jgi:hypothetical protein
MAAAEPDKPADHTPPADAPPTDDPTPGDAIPDSAPSPASEAATATDGSAPDGALLPGSATSETPPADPAPSPASSNDPTPDDAPPSPAPADDSTSDTQPSHATPPNRKIDIVGGTVPAWWTWVGRHRKAVGLIAGLVVVAVVVVLVAVPTVSERSPEDVVQSYLDAIRSGDTQAALEIAGEPAEDDRLRFLSADALADDWTVDAVVERHVFDGEADVDVTLRAGKTTQQGRFRVVKGDGGWRIESPFVKVDLTVGGLDLVELGGVRRPVERDETTQSIPLLLFPGVYELYPSLADRITFDQPLLIATPRETDSETIQFTAGYTLTDAGAEAAQKAVNAGVDACAKQPVLGPPGCPFDVSENSAIWDLEDVTDVAWTVVAHPEAHFARTNGGGIDLVVRKPGTVKVTGTGLPDGVPFALTCEFGLDNLTFAVTADGVEIGKVTGDDYSAALTTECF